MGTVKEVRLLSNLGDNVRSARAHLNISAEELSRRSGVTMNTIYQIENGVQESPRLGTIIKISEGLGVTVSGLLEEPKAKAS